MLVTENPPRYFLGIDLGGTNIASAVVDEFGNVYGRATRKTAMPRQYNEIFDDMALCAKEAAVNNGIKWENIESVGIGCPGAINKETGHLFRGAFGTGAELGHAVIISNGEKCTCGRNGCLEAYASATALINQAKIKAKENPDCEIMKLCKGDVDRINGKTVFTANDDVAKNVIDTYLNYLSEGIVNI